MKNVTGASYAFNGTKNGEGGLKMECIEPPSYRTMLADEEYPQHNCRHRLLKIKHARVFFHFFNNSLVPPVSLFLAIAI